MTACEQSGRSDPVPGPGTFDPELPSMLDSYAWIFGGFQSIHGITAARHTSAMSTGFR